MITKDVGNMSRGIIVSSAVLLLLILAMNTLGGCGRKYIKSKIELPTEQMAYQEAVVKTIPSIEERGWPERVLHYENIAVEHEVLYLEGPYERYGSNDGYFRTWDWDSGFSVGASPAIFVGKTFLLPFSMVIAPPWRQQSSRSGYPVAEPAYELPVEASGMAVKEIKK